MPDSVFREKQYTPKTEEHEVVAKNDPITDIADNVEVPYTDAKDFLENYFGLGTEWKDQDALFFTELTNIDTYIKYKIKEGEIENSQKAVKNILKGMEKLNNLKQEGRSVVKLEVLSNYVDFLMKNDDLKSKLRRYSAN